MAVIAAARNAGVADATTWELDDTTSEHASKNVVISTMADQKDLHMTGGTMRLGDYHCHLAGGSLAAKVYGTTDITERHRHRGECDSAFTDQFEKWGIKASGINPDNGLVEVIEGLDHPFLLASQFHPEFKSRPNRPHPMFTGFVEAAIAQNTHIAGE